ncbi:MAG: oxidoreductase, partial [Chitinophagaceae bacterium]
MDLFSPVNLRNLTLKNRVVLSPMQQYSAKNGVPGNWHLVHLGSRAVGGAGLIITECTAVAPEGRATLSDVGIWNEEQKIGWKNIVDFVHEQDTKIAIQLWHSGGKGSLKHPNEGMKPLTPEEGGWIVKSCSTIEMNGVAWQEFTIEEIRQLKLDFANAAKRAVEAGFDAMEIHAGHGYLFHQFYSAITNKRQDEYGGSFENRIRFLVETVQEIRAVIPENMPLLV